jgi:hypothetical protein
MIGEPLGQTWQIVIPQSARAAVAHIEAELLSLAGGYTRSLAMGAWRNGGGDSERERVIVFEVSLSPTVFGSNSGVTPDYVMERLAQAAGRIGEQEAVYVRDGDGRGWLVRPPGEVP